MTVDERTPLHGQPRTKRSLVSIGLVGLVVVAGVFIALTVFQGGSIVQHSTTFACDSSTQETGYIKLANKKDDQYFYWYVESRDDPATDPLVVWLQGGPGCSSVMAFLTENGPCTIKRDLTTELNPHSWTNNANMLWLDQPTDVGFSYTTTVDDNDDNENDVGENFYAFLQGFLDKHPELEGRPLFVTGESYAGHYVPAVAHKIWHESKKNSTSATRINLQGIAIGNGITNPLVQVAHTLDMVNNRYNITLLNETEYEQARAAQQADLELVRRFADTKNVSYIDDAMDAWGRLASPFQNAHRNIYDIRLPCDPSRGSSCYDYDYVHDFLNSEAIKAKLNIPEDKEWLECNPTVGMPFMISGDIVTDFESYVADLLDQSDIRVLLYDGDADTVCNWYGVKAWATALNWTHTAEFNAAEEHPFLTSNGSVDAGIVKAYTNQFTFLRLYNAGHMAPRDQPAVSLEMLTKFLRGDSF
ncbi:hypothetical protein Poli38472_004057 [Pythium oligandrum]|uniref:Carboxypeptidase n=1 Tax=Pythium oligandrum TaxID=41045 RepID=A0A8K1CMJ2_PYTOL|nr:hypothetical protein Poli38472_004057 [Pythium oligandrum]|eukprot:TMW66292.1 hypothetical protein Poli38472_004057 [Pythium oligandrum]